ncbi:metal-dependent hydrolase [Aurantiacibacter rhizosphaerae]|uniref:Metal-dependent hydrolase n=1 Tax=Aurantiacibacter rhizosphaerae TaxID=2691582 RepID=A0A844XDH2_9SPHN|nr:metal-dependent hydrolase [Aurantiacibacter rhizosphaerae]MWV28517.1 metal-dependent hydrolase [Aurantiacibacter rhizosphaerae]
MTAYSPWQASTPDGHRLTVRNRRFARGQKRQRGVDPVASAWFAALSCSFPRGEAMFIEAVKAHRDGVPEKLAEEIRDFIRQEVNHSREHIAFNRAIEDAGYDISAISARVNYLVDQTLAAKPIVQLAITCALEHFTAMFAHQFLKNPGALATAGMGDPKLWLWHAVEEIEHKAVAYDTWLHATRNWSAFKRWRVRSIIMLLVTFRFLKNRSTDAAELLAQDGITGWRAKWRMFSYLFRKPGILRTIAPSWLGYFRPGFHPWDHDDRYLIARFDEAEEADAENDTNAAMAVPAE